TWVFDGLVSVDDLTAADAAAEQIAGPVSISFDPDAEAIGVQTELSTSNVQLRDAALPVFGSSVRIIADTVIDLAASRAILRTVRLDGAESAFSAAGDVAFNLSRLDVSGDGVVTAGDDLPTVRLDRWQARRSQSEEPIEVTLSGGAATDLLPEDVRAWLGPEAGFQVVGSSDLSETFTVASVDLEAGETRLTGSGRLVGNAITGEATFIGAPGRINDVEFGAMDLQMTAEGAIDDLAVSLAASAEHMLVSGQTIEAPRVTVTSSIRDGAISGTLEAAATVEGEDVRLMAEPSLADQVWQVAALDIAYGDFTAAGQLAGDGRDLSALVGQIDLDGPIPVAIGGTRPTVTGTLSLTEETVFSDLSVSGVQGEGFDVETLDLKGAGQRDSITGTLASSGRVTIDGVSNPFDLAMPLSANLADQTIEARPAGQLADIAFETHAPLTITFGDQSAQLAGRLGLLGGDIAVEAVQAPDVITASVNASGLTITDAARLFGQRGLRGDLSAQMSLSGAADDVTGAGKIELVGVSRADASGPPADILLDLSLSGDELLITGRGEAPA
ncbi:MAG: hypothetical protein AAFR01_12470, partial [Pseudomonadota bacterium]